MAIRIQLPTGKTVYVNSIMDALEFDYEKAWADDAGYEINDPFSEVIDREYLIYEEPYIKLEIKIENIGLLEDIEKEFLDEDFREELD